MRINTLLRNTLLLLLLTASHKMYAQVALPYGQSFDDISDFEAFVVADENNDQQTWRYDDIMQAAKSGRDYDADDWLITPIFELEGGKTYELTFKSYIYMNGGEMLSVYLGTSKRVSSFVTELMEPTMITSEAPFTYTVAFAVDESDDYRIGFHHSTEDDPYSNVLYIDDITLDETTSLSAPQPVSDFTVTPGEKGSLSATLSLITPATSVDDSPLTQLDKVDIYRDNLLIRTFNQPDTGTLLSFEDSQGVSNGLHTYKAIAVNSSGPSDPAEQQVFIGIDLPGPVRNLHFDYDYSTHHAVITWDPPTEGVHGGYIDPTSIQYSVRKYMQKSGTTLCDPIAETIFEDDVDIAWLDSMAEIRYKELEDQYHYPVARTIVVDGQGLMYYNVKSVTAMGEGEETKSEVRIIGEPYTLPFEESFPNGYATHFWYKPVTPNQTRWYEMSDNRFTQDGDSGFLAFTTQVVDEISTGDPETTRAQTGRLNLSGCASPVITLYYLYAYAMQNPLKVKVSTDGQEFTTVGELDLTQDNLAGQYILAVVPLTAIANVESCYVALEATLANSTELIYVDNIAIYNQHDDDLTARITYLPAYLRSEQPRTVRVAVSNLGLNDADYGSYRVKIYVDDQEAGSVDGPALGVGELSEVNIETTATSSMNAESEIYAEIDYPADDNTDNNRSKVRTIEVRYPSFPAPQNLLLAQGDGVTLQWQSPEAPRSEDEAYTDSFEDYEDFTITDLGDWVLVDGDKTLTYSWGENYEWPNRTRPHAFIVMNPSEVVLGSGGKGLDPIWNAHSGEKMLMSSSFWADDWLISPELSGRSQTISFFARGTNSYTETFDVRYSTTDTEPSSFTLLDNEVTVNGAAWKQYDYTLPEGARYFAIHKTSFDGDKFFVDDVTFVPERLARQDITLLGYNVYCDGERLNGALVTQTSFADDTPREEGTYTVTAIYDKGESACSNPATLVSGIEELSVPGLHPINNAVYDLQGRRVSVQARGIYIQNGRKVVVK